MKQINFHHFWSMRSGTWVATAFVAWDNDVRRGPTMTERMVLASFQVRKQNLLNPVGTLIPFARMLGIKGVMEESVMEETTT